MPCDGRWCWSWRSGWRRRARRRRSRRVRLRRRTSRSHRSTLPDGAVPEVLAADGDQLLVGVHREGAPQPPGLVRRGPDGTVTEIPAQAATGYGRTGVLVLAGHRRHPDPRDRRRPRRRARQRALERLDRLGDRRGGARAGVQHLRRLGRGRPDRRGARARRRSRRRIVAERRRRARRGRVDPAGRRLGAALLDRHARCRARAPSVAFATAATGFGPGVMVAGWQVATGAGGARPRWCGSPGRTRRAGTRPCCPTRARRAPRRRSGARPPHARWREGGRQPGAVAPRRRPVEPCRGPPADRGRGLRPARRPAGHRRIADRDRRRPGAGHGRRGGGDDVDAEGGGAHRVGHGGGPGRPDGVRRCGRPAAGRPTRRPSTDRPTT